MITHGCNADIANGGLELDQRMSAVMLVRWAGLAIGTEISVMADCTLVTVASNIVGLVDTKRTITVDSVMGRLASKRTKSAGSIVDWLVEGNESMAWMDELGIWHASSAIIPIWAIQALVSDTIDIAIASITDSLVGSVAARLEKCVGQRIKLHVLHRRSKGVLWIMAMLQTVMAWKADIIILTADTGDEVILREFCIRLVHGPHRQR
jgi:small basic protein